MNPFITATTVTLNGETAPIYGGSFAGRITPAQALAGQIRAQRVNQAGGNRTTNASGVGI